jgi:hypothetical protein
VAPSPNTLLLLASLVATMTACTHVAPYQRAKLAHPTMATSDLAGPGEAHVRAVHEGATGGTVGAESGCGCN